MTVTNSIYAAVIWSTFIYNTAGMSHDHKASEQKCHGKGKKAAGTVFSLNTKDLILI